MSDIFTLVRTLNENPQKQFAHMHPGSKWGKLTMIYSDMQDATLVSSPSSYNPYDSLLPANAGLRDGLTDGEQVIASDFSRPKPIAHNNKTDTGATSKTLLPNLAAPSAKIPNPKVAGKQTHMINEHGHFVNSNSSGLQNSHVVGDAAAAAQQAAADAAAAVTAAAVRGRGGQRSVSTPTPAVYQYRPCWWL